MIAAGTSQLQRLFFIIPNLPLGRQVAMPLHNNTITNFPLVVLVVFTLLYNRNFKLRHIGGYSSLANKQIEGINNFPYVLIESIYLTRVV